MNNETGEVTLRGTPRSGCAHTFTRIVRCENGANPQNITFFVGDRSFPMTPVGNNKFTVTVDTGRDLPAGNGPFSMRVTYTCGAVNNSTTVGNVILFDPSGVIRDLQTGAPIAGATVTLYRVPAAVPDKPNQPGACRTVETRGSATWEALPATTRNETHRINPELDTINNIVQIDPLINPQVTGSDGSYAWNVVEGCWYIAITAPGYKPKVSPLVGVPPAVTDLHLGLEKAPNAVYLPMIRRR